MAVMVDSCVYLDIFTRDPDWCDWSGSRLASAASAGKIIINPEIYAEISVRFEKIEQLEALLPHSVFDYCQIPRAAAFLAGKCYQKYRRRGGSKLHPLPDFFIGAHAAVADIPLITRDTRRFREYFPKLHLVTP